MASKRTYQFDIAAGIQGAIDAVNELSSITQTKLDGIDWKTGISAFRDGFDLVKGAAETAFSAIEGFANKAIEESLNAQKANDTLANSLRLSGDYSEQAVQSFDALGDAIEATTNFTGDAVKESVALAKQYRLTNAEATRAIQVATDLAAVQGTTLEQATQKVVQTFNGFVDKSLAKVIPGLKNLSKEALISGDAIGLIQGRVQGSAEILGNTFAGALARARGALNKIYETFGNLVTQNSAIIAGLNEISKAFREFSKDIEKSGDSMQRLVTDGFLLLIESAPLVIKSLRSIDGTLSTLVASTKTFIITVTGLPTALLQATTGTFDALDDLKQRLAEVNDAVKFSERDTVFYDPLIKKATELAERVRKAAEEAEKQKKAFQNLGQSNTGQEERLKDAFSPEDVRKKVESAAKEPLKFAFEAAVSATEITPQQGIAIGAGLVSNVLKGAQGAQKLLQETIGAAADAFLPGIGGAVSEIVGVLSQGPEVTKKMVEDFANAIPTLIENLADSLPVLIEALVRSLPPALAKAMPTVAVGFTTSLVSKIPEIVKGFATGLVDSAKQFVQAIIDEIKGAAGGVFDGITGSGDSNSIFAGIPVLQGIGDIFGFASGGRIPDMPQYRNDGAIIRADAGEQIFNKDLTERMERYLDANEGASGQTYVGTLQLQMGLETFANLSLEADRRGLRLRATQ